MPRASYIYIIRKADEKLALAYFTVLQDAISFAARKNLLPPTYEMERVSNGTWAMPTRVKKWEEIAGALRENSSQDYPL